MTHDISSGNRSETLVVTGREYFLIEFNYHRFPAVFRKTRDASPSLRTELSGSPVNENLYGRKERRKKYVARRVFG